MIKPTLPENSECVVLKTIIVSYPQSLTSAIKWIRLLRFVFDTGDLRAILKCYGMLFPPDRMDSNASD